MQVSFDYDQDPRYRWANIYAKSGESCLIVVHEDGVSRGFTYKDGVMTPTCICHAYSENECCCTGVVWD